MGWKVQFLPSPVSLIRNAQHRGQGPHRALRRFGPLTNDSGVGMVVTKLIRSFRYWADCCQANLMCSKMSKLSDTYWV